MNPANPNNTRTLDAIATVERVFPAAAAPVNTGVTGGERTCLPITGQNKYIPRCTNKKTRSGEWMAEGWSYEGKIE